MALDEIFAVKFVILDYKQMGTAYLKTQNFYSKILNFDSNQNLQKAEGDTLKKHKTQA